MSLEPVVPAAVPKMQPSEGAAAWLQAATPLLVTGAPYCGASILAQALVNAGWFPGDRIAPLREGDPAGGVQDEEIGILHRRILTEHEVDPADVRTLERAESLEPNWETAPQLLYRKFHDRSVWGWKYTQATLLLEQWDRLLPSARWLIAVRPPALFAWSLLVRGLASRMSPYPLASVQKALRLWTAYHARILRFAQERRDRCAVLIVPDDIGQSQELNAILRAKWGYDLRPVDLASVYNPHLIKKQTPRWIAAFTRSHLPAQRLFGQLQRLESRPAARHLERAGDGHFPNEARPKLCLATTYPFRISETFILAHATRLPAEVKLLTALPWPATGDGLRLDTLLDRVTRKVVEEFRNVDLFQKATQSIARYFRQEKIDAVLAEFGPNGCVVMEACRQCRIPLIVHFHGYDVYHATAGSRGMRDRYPDLFSIASAIVGVSHDMIAKLAEMGAPREKLFYNPCGVDVSQFTGADPANNPPTFLAVGRFVEKKAPHLSVLAFKQLLERVPEARLVMIGSGELLEAVKHVIKALGISESVEIANARSHHDVAAAMRKARAFIQHSVRTSDGNAEGTPVSVLEAGASGLPVVVTRHTGIPEVVLHGETGFLVDEYDIGAMAEAMQTLAEDPALAGRLGKAARQHISDNHSMDKSISRLWNVIEGTLHK